MSNWPIVKLGEVVTPVFRAVPTMPGTAYRQIGVKLWGEGAYERESIDGSQTKYAQLFRTETGDIIVNKIWARNGSVAVVSPDLSGCFGSNEFPMFTPKPDRLESRWIHWLTKMRSFWEQCDEKSHGTSGKNRIKPEQFLSVEIPLPPLADQRHIVARIEELTAQINEVKELRQRAAKELEVSASIITDHAFSKLVNHDKLESVCTFIVDGTHQTPRYTDEGNIFLSAKNIKPFRFIPDDHRNVSTEDFNSYTKRHKPELGDVLLTRVGSGIGEAAVVDQNIEFAIYVSLALIRTDKEKLLPEFLIHWLNSPQGRKNSHQSTLGRAHSQGNLNLKLLRETNIPLPSVHEQGRIVKRLNAFRAKIDALNQLQVESIVEMNTLLPAVLNRAFKGKF